MTPEQMIVAKASFDAEAARSMAEALECIKIACPATASTHTRKALVAMQRSIDIGQHMMTWWPVQQVAA